MDIYREEILEHWRNPQNFGEMERPDLVIDQVNPLCGDEITLYIKLNDNRSTINDIRFTGKGCAISIATASILSENIRGKSLSLLSKMTGKDVLKMIGGPPAGGFPPARLKCAFLPLEALRRAQGKLKINGKKVSNNN